jgi:hypothetical protein
MSGAVHASSKRATCVRPITARSRTLDARACFDFDPHCFGELQSFRRAGNESPFCCCFVSHSSSSDAADPILYVTAAIL